MGVLQVVDAGDAWAEQVRWSCTRLEHWVREVLLNLNLKLNLKLTIYTLALGFQKYTRLSTYVDRAILSYYYAFAIVDSQG